MTLVTPPIALTQSPQTKIEYIKTHERNRKKCAEIIKIDPANLTDIRYVEWLCSHKFNIAVKSWQVYKASSLHALRLKQEQYKLDNYGMEDQDLHFAILQLAAEPQTGAHKKGQLTSALKPKFIKEETMDELLIHLESKTGSEWSQRAAKFIRATIKVGVRPCEWENASIDSNCLIVQNAKATNGKANGKERAIPYTEEAWDDWLTFHIESNTYMDEARSRFLLAKERAASTTWESAEFAVNEQLTAVSLWKQNNPELKFVVYTRMVAMTIKRACSSLWPKEKKALSLYTLRHQFIANMKNILPDVGISELVGHHSIDTAKLHYAKASQGNKDFKRTGKELRAEAQRMQDENTSSHELA